MKVAPPQGVPYKENMYFLSGDRYLAPIGVKNVHDGRALFRTWVSSLVAICLGVSNGGGAKWVLDNLSSTYSFAD